MKLTLLCMCDASQCSITYIPAPIVFSARLENSSLLDYIVLPNLLLTPKPRPMFSPCPAPSSSLRLFPKPRLKGSEHNVLARERDNTDRKGRAQTATPPMDGKLGPLFGLAD